MEDMRTKLERQKAYERRNKEFIRKQNLERERARTSASSGSQPVPMEVEQPTPMEVEQPAVKEEFLNVAETAGTKRGNEKLEDKIKRARLGEDVISGFPKIMNDHRVTNLTIQQQLMFRGIPFKDTDTKPELMNIVNETVKRDKWADRFDDKAKWQRMGDYIDKHKSLPIKNSDPE